MHYISIGIVITFILLTLVEAILKREKKPKEKRPKIHIDNQYINRYYMAFFFLGTSFLYLNQYGLEIITYICLGLSVFSFIFISIKLYRTYYKKLVYTIYLRNGTKQELDILRELNSKNDNFNITFPDFAPPRLIIEQEHFNEKESILEIVNNELMKYRLKQHY